MYKQKPNTTFRTKSKNRFKKTILVELNSRMKMEKVGVNDVEDKN